MTRRLLFVDDEPSVLEGLARTLGVREHDWEMHFAVGADEALTLLEAGAFDVVVSDLRMPEIDGATLLGIVREQWPATMRLILSGPADAATMGRAVRVAQQFLNKPCDIMELERTIERLLALRDLLGDELLRSVAGVVEALPSVPSVFAALERALHAPGAVIPQIARIVERDAALAAKVLQLVSSSFFGRPLRVARVDQAIGYLGFNVLRSVVLSHELAQSFGAAGLGRVLSIEAHQRHALVTAGIARRLAPPGLDADTVFMAGVLHDAGELLLASQLTERFRHYARLAEERRLPAHVIEREEGVASHAEVGAYLLGAWGLPSEIVMTAAHHHRPREAPAQVRHLVGVVHVADAVAHMVGDAGGLDATAPSIDEEWVEGLGGLGDRGRWRAIGAEVAESTP